MEDNSFCFLDDSYYIDFPDPNLMKNKERINGTLHNRPCFFAFSDKDCPEIYWLVPVSTQVEKYKSLYQKKVERYGKCNTLVFGELLGKTAVFLIQNMCPVTQNYIHNIYMDKNEVLVQIDRRVAKNITKNAQQVLLLVKKGHSLVFPDVLSVYNSLRDRLE